MNKQDQAKIILEAMDNGGIQVDWNMEKFYIDHIRHLEEMKDTHYKNEPDMQASCQNKIEKISRLLWKF